MDDLKGLLIKVSNDSGFVGMLLANQRGQAHLPELRDSLTRLVDTVKALQTRAKNRLRSARGEEGGLAPACWQRSG